MNWSDSWAGTTDAMEDVFINLGGNKMSNSISIHAKARLQQRAISMPVLDCLLNFGSKVHDHRGAEILFFDRRARDRVRHAVGEKEFKCVQAKLNSYAVVAVDGLVLTVGHRTKRIRRH